MKCEFDYCIYNRRLLCILKEVQLNALGICDECVMATIPEEVLEILMKKQLNDIESRWKSKLDN